MLCCVRLFVASWTVAHQAPLSMGSARQEYWSGLPFPSPVDFPNPGIEPRSPALQANSLLFEPPGKPSTYIMGCYKIGLIVKWLEQRPLELFLCFYHLPLYYFPVVDKSQKKLSLISYSLLLQVCSSDWNPEGENNTPYVILLFFFLSSTSRVQSKDQTPPH